MAKIGPEEALHLLIAQYLTWIIGPPDSLNERDLVWTTIENSNQQGGNKGRIKQQLLKEKGALAGWPDIMIIDLSKTVPFILLMEVKSKRGRIQDHQKELARKLDAYPNVMAKFVRSVDDVKACLEEAEIEHKESAL